ncbi:TPA: AAA family ATPase [Bacillus albus]
MSNYYITEFIKTQIEKTLYNIIDQKIEGFDFNNDGVSEQQIEIKINELIGNKNLKLLVEDVIESNKLDQSLKEDILIVITNYIESFDLHKYMIEKYKIESYKKQGGNFYRKKPPFPFITGIQIHNVRHHKNHYIPLKKNQPMNLIITGKNGSGKTSFFEAIRDYLSVVENYSLEWIKKQKKDLIRYKETIKDLLKEDENYTIYRDAINNNSRNLKHYTEKVELDISNTRELDELFEQGKYIIAYFSAQRVTNMITPYGVEKVILPQRSSATDNNGGLFIKYLVDLKTRSAHANNEGDYAYHNKMEKWFNFLEEQLKIIFENAELQLKYDYNEYNFYIYENGKNPYTLNELSSGFSSILNIVTEVIMRMEHIRGNLSYEVPGIVIIDEIDAHLHVSLQKNILHFLISLFPNIQFIVSTHSPFVLNSVEDVIIWDMDRNEVNEDFSNYSYEAILEEYFKVDQNSVPLKKRINEYLDLLSKEDLSEKENLLLEKLEKTLINQHMSSETQFIINNAKLKKRYGGTIN